MTLDPHPFRLDQLLRDLSVILSATWRQARSRCCSTSTPRCRATWWATRCACSRC